MSSFANTAEKENREGYLGRGCGVGILLGKLKPALRKEVAEVLKDRPDISTAAVRRALIQTLADGKQAGDPKVPSEYTWTRHRNNKCQCKETSS